MQDIQEIEQQSEPIKQETGNPVDKPKEPGVTVPTSFIRWVCYTVFFGLILLPLPLQFLTTVWQYVSLTLVLAHFAGQLNKIIDK